MRLLALALTAAALAVTSAANAQPREGIWAVDNINNCRVPSKVYNVQVEVEHPNSRYSQDDRIIYQFENVATGSFDVEERTDTPGDMNMHTTTIRSVRAHGTPNAVGTTWEYADITSDLIKVYRNDQFAYFIVRCY
jgi:hypothetical protein